MFAENPVFCTVFDKNYLVQALALHSSIQTHVESFSLYCLALDDLSIQTLNGLQLKGVKVIGLSDLDQTHFAHIKKEMSWAQLCWTMQPLVCTHILDLGESHVTYLETDSLFFSNPGPLFKEIGKNSVSLVPHFFSERYQKLEAQAGRFCVQFNFFRNDSNARECLKFWLAKCLEYRADHPADYPGQTCLDQWEKRFKGVLAIQNRGAGIAPWNIQQYRVRKEGGKILVNGEPAIFFHFHQLARYKNGDFELGGYPISKTTYEFFYKPYILLLLSLETELKKKANGFAYRRELAEYPSLFTSIKKRIRGVYNVISLSSLGS